MVWQFISILMIIETCLLKSLLNYYSGRISYKFVINDKDHNITLSWDLVLCNEKRSL